MIKTISKVLVIGFVILLIPLGAGSPEASSEQGMPFSVEPILPYNQVKGVESYISINSDELEDQKFNFTIENKSNEAQKIKIDITDATTSPNGSIQYLSEQPDNSIVMKDDYKLSNHLKYPEKTVEIKPKETKTISTKLEVDDIEKNNGDILGGVNFSILEEGEKVSGGDSSFQIDNKINLVIGVLINSSDRQTSEFEIGDAYIDPMPSYYAVRLPIDHKTPMLLQDADISYEVFLDDELLFDGSRKLDFAPVAKTNISLPFDHDNIKDGAEYTIKGTLSYSDIDDKTITKEFEKAFKYDKDKSKDEAEANSFNAPSEYSSTPWIIYALLTMSILALIFVIFLIRRNKNTKKDIENDDTKISS